MTVNPSNRAGRAAVAGAAFAAALGALVVLGHLLDLADVLEGYWFTAVSLPAGIGLLALGLGLWLAWLAWRGKPALAPRPTDSAGERIALAGALVLAAGIAAAGLATFVLMKSSMERLLTAELASALRGRQASISRAAERALAQTAEIVVRPNLVRIYAEPSADARASNNRAFLPTIAASLIRSEFEAIAFLDADGGELARAGTFAADSALRFPLAPRPGPRGALVWDGGFVLDSSAQIVKDGVRLGEVRAQHRLEDLKGMMTDAANLGPTGEFALCAPRAGELLCAPTRFQSRPFAVPAVIGGKRLPMSHALAGDSGVQKLTDYRGKRVLAAYAPLTEFGAGLVLKTDLSDFYAPVRELLGVLALTLLLVSAAGGWLLRVSVRPLARRLAGSEARLRMALENSHFAVWDWDILGDQVYLSERWSEMLGGPARGTTIGFEELSALAHPEDAAELRGKILALLKGAISHYSVEHRVRTRSGEWLWIRSRGQVVERARDGQARRAIGTNVDISERKREEFELAHRAAHDALTGLPNRGLFQDRLEQAILRSRRGQLLMAVMYIDVDKFKGINDTLGHAAGDAVLKEFARRLSGELRARDTVARLGGDEFAVILEEVAARDDALRVARKIVAAMRARFVLESGAAALSASAGIAFHDGTAEVSPAALIAAADRALYEAKAAGRDGYRAAE